MNAKSAACWNCGRRAGSLRSKRTGIAYCARCGASIDGTRWLSAEDVLFGMTADDAPDDQGDALGDDGLESTDGTEEQR